VQTLKAGKRILHQTVFTCVNAVGWPGLCSTTYCWRKWRLCTTALWPTSSLLLLSADFVKDMIELLSSCQGHRGRAGTVTQRRRVARAWHSHHRTTRVTVRQSSSRWRGQRGRNRLQSGAVANLGFGNVFRRAQGVGQSRGTHHR
jgi:hypothetical protein